MSSAVPNVPATLTLLESGFTLRPGTEHEFMNMSEKITGVAVEQPGFLSVGGGPIAESSWLYFTVKFETPADMDAWHHDERHQPVQKLAKARWFGRMYLRKWRVRPPAKSWVTASSAKPSSRPPRRSMTPSSPG